MKVSRSSSGVASDAEAAHHDEERVDLPQVAELRRPDPGTSCTRIVAGVTFRAFTTAASAPSRSSAIGAMPTFVFPYSPPPALVSAVKSAVFPLPDGPTMPTSSATARNGSR